MPFLGKNQFWPNRRLGRFSQIRSHSYMLSKKIVIERTRDLIYLKFVATDFSPNNKPQCWWKLRWLSVALAILQFLPCWWTLYQIVLIICHFATPTTSLRINTSLVSFPDPAFTKDKGLVHFTRNLGLADPALPEIWRTIQIAYRYFLTTW